jgi:hypothetical protein
MNKPNYFQFSKMKLLQLNTELSISRNANIFQCIKKKEVRFQVRFAKHVDNFAYKVLHCVMLIKFPLFVFYKWQITFVC